MRSAPVVPRRPEHIGWRALLVGGVALFVVTAWVMLRTANPNLYPTVVLIGSFLVPIAFVAFLQDGAPLS